MTRRASAEGAARVVLGIAITALGVVTAPVASLVSRMCWRPDLVTVPYGMVVAVAGSMAVVVLGAAVSRGFALLAAVGWIIGLVFVVNGTSGGSFVIASDALGWSFLVLGTLATLGTAMWGSAVSGAPHHGGPR